MQQQAWKHLSYKHTRQVWSSTIVLKGARVHFKLCLLMLQVVKVKLELHHLHMHSY